MLIVSRQATISHSIDSVGQIGHGISNEQNQFSAPSQCIEMIENVKIYLHFVKTT